MQPTISRKAAATTISSTHVTSSVSLRGARQQRAVATAAAVGSTDTVVAARRQALLLLGAGSIFAAAVPAQAITLIPTVCADQETGEAADACRAKTLARDAGKQESYTKFEGRADPKTAINVPVSKMDDEYSRATVQLADNLESYFTMDVYDKARVPLIKEMKSEAQAWVTKYARGGSVRKQSARRFYIAVDAVLGHLASNGLAPFPARKADTVRSSIAEARALLAEAK